FTIPIIRILLSLLMLHMNSNKKSSLLLIFLCVSVRPSVRPSVRTLSALPKVAARLFELWDERESHVPLDRFDWPAHIPITHALCDGFSRPSVPRHQHAMGVY